MSATTLVTTGRRRALAAEDAVHAFCLRHSVTFLRTALGAIFILFGALKFFPNLSPAQAVAEMTTQKLTFGLVPAQSLLYVVAVVEVAVGLLLISNKAMRFALWLLAFEMFAILSPIVLLSGELFSGPHHLPSLLGQYILKDFVLLGAVLVLFAMQRGVITSRTGDADRNEADRNVSPALAPGNAHATAGRALAGAPTTASGAVAPTGAHRPAGARPARVGQHGRTRYSVR